MPVKLEHRIGVQAPAETIWEIISDLSSWHAWNPLYPQAEGSLRIGGQLSLTLALPGHKPETIKPTIVDWVPRDQIHWTLKMGGGLVRTYRFIEIEVLGETSCIFSNGELFDGLLGPFIARRMRRSIRKGFAEMGEALKDRAEYAWCMDEQNIQPSLDL